MGQKSPAIRKDTGTDHTRSDRPACLLGTGTGSETGNLVFRVPYTTEVMRIQSNGNVGIGTTSPSYPLDVNGNIHCVNTLFVDSGNSQGFLRFTSLGGTNYIQSALTNSTSSSAPLQFGNFNGSNTWMTIQTGGNIGINTTNPYTLLDIRTQNSTITLNPTLTILSNDSNGNYGPAICIGANTGSFNFFKLGFFTNNLGSSFNKFVIGYNTTGTSFQSSIQADTAGLVYLPGYTTNGTLSLINNNGVAQISNASDIRLKTDIIPLTTGALNEILELNPVEFKFKSDPNNTRLGFIAQDVERVIPEAVDGKKHEYELLRDETGVPILDIEGKVQIDPAMIPRYRGLDTTAILAKTVKAMKEQQEIINIQKMEIQELKELVNKLISLNNLKTEVI